MLMTNIFILLVFYQQIIMQRKILTLFDVAKVKLKPNKIRSTYTLHSWLTNIQHSTCSISKPVFYSDIHLQNPVQIPSSATPKSGPLKRKLDETKKSKPKAVATFTTAIILTRDQQRVFDNILRVSNEAVNRCIDLVLNKGMPAKQIDLQKVIAKQNKESGHWFDSNTFSTVKLCACKTFEGNVKAIKTRLKLKTDIDAVQLMKLNNIA